MLAQLGSVLFERLLTFDSLTSQRSATLPQLPLIGSKPRLQFTGSELERIDFAVRLHSGFADPEAAIASLEAYRATGEIVPFILGTGENRGDFVVENIQVDILHTDANGAIINAMVGVSIVEHYDPDKLATATAAALTNAAAIRRETLRPLSSATVSAVTQIRVAPGVPATTPYDAARVMSSVSTATVSASSINDTILKIGQYPNRANYYGQQIAGKLRQVQTAMDNASNILSSTTSSLSSRFPAVSPGASAVSASAATFLAAIPGGSSAIAAANTNFQRSVSNLASSAVGLAQLIATRKR